MNQPSLQIVGMKPWGYKPHHRPCLEAVNLSGSRIMVETKGGHMKIQQGDHETIVQPKDTAETIIKDLLTQGGKILLPIDRGQLELATDTSPENDWL